MIRNFIIVPMLLLTANISYALEITFVSHRPEIFSPASNEKVNIGFTISETADVSLNIYDDRSLLIRQITKSAMDKGAHIISWDGKDQKGRSVPPEAYGYTITVTNGASSAEYDLSDYTGNEQFAVDNVVWNKDKSKFEYTLKKPSRVFIRVGLDNHGPLLATLLSWVPRSSGKHAEKWDGMDVSKVMNLSSHPNMIIDMQAYQLSDNTILVGPEAVNNSYLNPPPMGDEKRTVKYKHHKKMLTASQLAPETRGDYVVQLKLPPNLKQNDKGVSVVSGIVPVMLDVDDAHRSIATNRRSEPVMYVDGKFFIENEVGYLPMTWKLDTSRMSEGEHFLTVNLRGYEGNFGIASVKIYVKHL